MHIGIWFCEWKKCWMAWKYANPLRRAYRKIVWQIFFVDAILYVHFDDMEKKARALNSDFFLCISKHINNSKLFQIVLAKFWFGVKYTKILHISNMKEKKEDIFVMTMASNIIIYHWTIYWFFVEFLTNNCLHMSVEMIETSPNICINLSLIRSDIFNFCVDFDSIFFYFFAITDYKKNWCF